MVNKNKTKNKVHDRYKVDICSQNSVIRTLGIPQDRPRVKVIEITRRELKGVSSATHAVIRALDGTEHTVYAKDSWLSCQLKALQL